MIRKIPHATRLSVLTFFLFLPVSLLSQDIHCGMCSPEAPAMLKSSSTSSSIETHGGAHLPFQGAIRGLVVFVQTQNDDIADAAWPLGQLPTWKDEYVDRMQRYCSDMSGGTMDLRLDVHPDIMLTKNTESGYLHWDLKFGFAIEEILDSLDVLMDFTNYDHWDSEGNAYALTETPDGKIDLLIFMFRSISIVDFLPFSGVSDLGFAGYHFLDGSLERFVYGGTGAWNDASSSGLTISYRPGSCAVMPQEYAFLTTIHEFGHKLFGEGHPAELYGGLGIMANASIGYAMNSFERRIAGYMDYRELTPERDTVITLRDYLTHDDAALISVPELQRSYFALEFRARKNEWDMAPAEGLYIYRIYDSWSNTQKRVLVISAEGAFDWELDSLTNTISPVRPSPLIGYNRLQRIPINGKTYWAEGWWGTPSTAFTGERTELAVLKNPTPDFIFGSDTIHTNLRIRLLEQTDSTATVQISYKEPTILDIQAEATPNTFLAAPYPHPVLTTLRNMTVPIDLLHSGDTRLMLYDALGREVEMLNHAYLEAGHHNISVALPVLHVGTYLLILETPSSRQTRLLLVMQ